MKINTLLLALVVIGTAQSVMATTTASNLARPAVKPVDDNGKNFIGGVTRQYSPDEVRALQAKVNQLKENPVFK